MHLTPEEMRESQHQAGVVHQIDIGIRHETGQLVDVAVGPHLSTGGRPEKRKLPGAVPPSQIRQFGLVGLRIAELERAAHDSLLR